MQRKRKPRTVIIGLDGVPHGLISRLSKKSVMPETGKLTSTGLLKKMQSSIPEISSVAWSSIITGKNPGEHGIFGYTDIPVGTYRLSFPNFNQLKAAPFWQKEAAEESVILNVPSTFPVKPLKGVHISGFVSLDLERSVYPQSLIPQLKKMDYRIDVNAAKAHTSLEMFINDLDKTLDARIAAYRMLWEMTEWDIFMMVFTGTDRLSHFLWNAYEDESHRFHSAFLEHFNKIDTIIGEISARLDPEDLLFVLSDHGFENLETEVNLNFLLRDNGFLKLNPESRKNYADLDSDSKAFALEPSRVYLNLTGKYPRGGVEPHEYDSLLDELTILFSSLTYNGKKVIKQIFRKEELYSGPYCNQAPDLVLLAERGFNLKAGLKASELFEKGVFTGKHTQDDAFLLINRSREEAGIPDKISVEDVCHILERMKHFENNHAA